MKSELSTICFYPKEKVPVSELTINNYVSTENLYPNKGGLVAATNLPTTDKTQKYKTGDILVSNIRPYFKKIWYATNDGGCSNDVLVFRAKEGVDSLFLYYVLSNDTFFEYSTATAKGTKMPRGDKAALLHYLVPDFDKNNQKRIAGVLSKIDNKIYTNKQINQNLEQQVSAIYQAWFEDFIPFEGKCPDNWEYAKLCDIAKITSGKRPPMKSPVKTNDAVFPIVGAASVMGFTTGANYTNRILVTGRVGTHGIIQRFNIPCWASDNTLVISSSYYEYTYQILKNIDYSSINRGSTQPLITQGDMNNTDVLLPDNSTILEFEEIAGTLMSQYGENNNENESLSELRDALLPKLMSGELDISNINL